MNRLKYLIIGVLALIVAGCGQTVDVDLKVAEGAGPNAAGSGKSVVVLPFADYSYADDLVSAHRRNLQIVETLTDKLVASGFGLPVQEDVFKFMVEQNIISMVPYEETSNSSVKDELASGGWSKRMQQQIYAHIQQQEAVKANKVSASPGTHGLTNQTIRKIGRHFTADYIIRGRILEYKTRQDPSWAPWKKGVLPFIVGSTSQMAYGFASSASYDQMNQETSGAAIGALTGYQTIWPFDDEILFGAAHSTSNAIFWGTMGGAMGNRASKSGRIDQAVVQMRIWVQEAATGNVIWTNRIRVQVSPESVFSDPQYDNLFNQAIDKAASTLMDNFITYGMDYYQ
ncbi:MAG: hypothetical protein CR981_00155 [Proteobacteria bacterium]|nr:MAG: hypothetical protein CR981_00155 [Pseudomonadota bacterium]PIE64766.1 MAG: hypothetical protein CSA26_06920 [Desulfobacterales bacterium]